MGRVFGEHWPALRFDLKGRLHGKGVELVDFTGTMNAGDFQFGEVRLHDAHLQIPKASWRGPLSGSWWRALMVEAKVGQLQGGVGKTQTSLVVTDGLVTLREEELTLAQLRGSYGKASRFFDASVSLRKLFAKNGPFLEARMTADLALEDDLPRILTALTPDNSTPFSQLLSHPQGRALAQLQMRQTGDRGVPRYNGSVTFQGASAQLLPWKLEVKDLNGRVEVDGNSLSFDALSFFVGQAELKTKGKVRDFLSPQRSADLQVVFTAVRDYDFAAFLPAGKVLPQGGLVNGDLSIVARSRRWSLSASSYSCALMVRTQYARIIAFAIAQFTH